VTLGSIEPCPEQPRRTPKYWWDRPRHHLEKCVYNRLANANWRGKFYMNLFPVGERFAKGADVLVASAQEITGSPEHSQFSFLEHDVGATRLERYDGAYWRRNTEDAGFERR